MNIASIREGITVQKPRILFFLDLIHKRFLDKQPFQAEKCIYIPVLIW